MFDKNGKPIRFDPVDRINVSMGMMENHIDDINSELDDYEEKNKKHVIIVDGHRFDLTKDHLHETVGSYVECVEIEKRTEVIEKYLNKKYENYNGVPFTMLAEETGLDARTVQNWIEQEFERKLKEKDNLFVPTSIVAQMVIANENK